MYVPHRFLHTSDVVRTMLQHLIVFWHITQITVSRLLVEFFHHLFVYGWLAHDIRHHGLECCPCCIGAGEQY